MPSSPPPQTALDTNIELTILHHGKPITFTFPPFATITDLSATVTKTLSIPATHQKYMITPKLGLLKPPFPDPSLPLTSLLSSHKKITLLGSTPTELSALTNPHPLRRPLTTTTTQPLKPATPTPYRNPAKAHAHATYTFHTLHPHPSLPTPSQSLAFLTRLRSDPGILTTMATHKFSVPLLTEMDPAAYTTHDSRTLGLNRNKGEVIELRLRTDAGDGYRDYRGVRRTLCHELAHCVWGEHDGRFWELCGRIEREVERGDWRSGGRRLTEEEFYNPEDARGGGGGGGEHVDAGGWTGGEFVLGVGGVASGGSGSGSGSGNAGAGAGLELSRRDILARAAEERMRKQKKVHQEANNNRNASGPPSSSPSPSS
ncbi:MAG: hypothetical protein M1830_001243 [Pleopsidium flavum]|nr:MAG: hypothetical protein M1830_001243 [Pleopsidium flavum]